MPSTRSSLPVAALVDSVNRCRARRSACAPRSWAARSTTGRQDVAATVGIANRTSVISTGFTLASRTTVTPRRRIQPAVEKTDMYMWSRVKICSRSTDSRSRYSGRSWCAIVEMPAWSRATWDSRAMVTLSRKRRWILVDTVASSQVATADTASATAANQSRPGLCWISPSPSSVNQTASSASGNAAARARTNDTPISAGSQRKPRGPSRPMAASAGGSRSGGSAGARAVSWPGPGDPAGSTGSGEDIEGDLLLAFLGRALGEPLRLQREHRPVPAAQPHQLLVAAELDDGPVFHDRDPVDVADRGEAVRDQDRRAGSRCREDPLEDLGPAA